MHGGRVTSRAALSRAGSMLVAVKSSQFPVSILREARVGGRRMIVVRRYVV